MLTSTPVATRLLPALLLAGGALIAVFRTPAHVDATSSATITCEATGTSWEKLTCDNAIKASKCFDAKVTCASWKLEDCCSKVPLHKCLLPSAGRAFDVDCSFPVDSREECCADPVTHKRAFKAIAKLGEATEAALHDAGDKLDAASDAVTKAIDDVGLNDAATAAVASAKDALDEASAAISTAIDDAGLTDEVDDAKAAAAAAVQEAKDALDAAAAAAGDDLEVAKAAAEDAIMLAKQKLATAAAQAQEAAAKGATAETE